MIQDKTFNVYENNVTEYNKLEFLPLNFAFFLECTVAGGLKMICERTLPFWWDDADNFSVLEKLAVAAFNKVIFFI